jgi:hypothetical protein
MADRIQKLLSSFTDVSTDTLLGTGDNLSVTPRVLIANKAGWTLYVQKIAVNVTTTNAATQQFRSITTDEVIAGTPASPALGVILFDFGADGYALPEGEGLELSNSGAGLGAAIAVQAYYRRTATFSGNTAPPAPIVGAV